MQTLSQHPSEVTLPVDLKFTHQDFIERLKHPQAADLVSGLKAYALAFFDLPFCEFSIFLGNKIDSFFFFVSL